MLSMLEIQVMQSFTLNRTANYSKLNEMKAHILAFNRVIELFFVSSRFLHHCWSNILEILISNGKQSCWQQIFLDLWIYIYIQPGVINCFKAEKVKKFFPFKDTANLFSRKRNFFKPPGKSYRVEQWECYFTWCDEYWLFHSISHLKILP